MLDLQGGRAVDAAGTEGSGGGPGGAGAAVPRLRGLLHAAAFPAVITAGVVLITFAPTQPGRLCATIYSLACMALFGVSAAYHRSPLGSRRRGMLARLDHVSILLLIAGTYTPLTVLALRGWTRISMLAIIWAAATAGILIRLVWRRTWRPAPRWLITSLFIALGWAAVLVLPQLLHGAGAAVLVLVLAGGVLYSLGAVVYALKQPDPSPQWFGFHEVFHAITIVAYLTQYAAVSLVIYRAA
jgi:hemolysin III